MTSPRLTSLLLCAASVFALTACGGSANDATIGGNINGLSNGTTISLQNNGADTLAMNGNGAASFTFAFPTALSSGAGYSATVSAQPLGQTCSVVNGTGNVDNNADDVTSIAVNCAVTSSVVAAVTGLNPGAGVVLSLNGVSSRLLSNESFGFPMVLAAGATYTVMVVTQPASGPTCKFANGATTTTGTIPGNTTVTVAVTCV